VPVSNPGDAGEQIMGAAAKPRCNSRPLHLIALRVLTADLRIVGGFRHLMWWRGCLMY
jgi:hypothetical protein